MNVDRILVIAGLLSVLAVTFALGSPAVVPKPMVSALPMYPEEARAARVAGVVKLSFAVNEKGEVVEATVVSGHPLLREAAFSAVKSWRFHPDALRREVRFETEFVYVLDVQHKEGEPSLTVSMTDFRRVKVVSELYVKAIE